ncbi:hypothetical protein BaOVIS_017080 [Babesia ovis]|uniref:Uncharacterized protein n=1 Tax=Babesia ovis TaxID=5869 RepID=A0A9W5TA15_BABOV|nr:hypothetical protein BaOVIS_017080 [Babesia ovis]
MAVIGVSEQKDDVAQTVDCGTDTGHVHHSPAKGFTVCELGCLSQLRNSNIRLDVAKDLFCQQTRERHEGAAADDTGNATVETDSRGLVLLLNHCGQNGTVNTADSHEGGTNDHKLQNLVPRQITVGRGTKEQSQGSHKTNDHNDVTSNQTTVGGVLLVAQVNEITTETTTKETTQQGQGAGETGREVGETQVLQVQNHVSKSAEWSVRNEKDEQKHSGSPCAEDGAQSLGDVDVLLLISDLRDVLIGLEEIPYKGAHHYPDNTGGDVAYTPAGDVFKSSQRGD